MFNLEAYLAEYSNLSILSPLAMGIVSFKYLTQSDRFFLFYILISTLIEIMLLYSVVFHLHNHYFINYFTLFETTLLLIFLYKTNFSSIYSRVLLLLIPAYLIVWVYFIFTEGLSTVNQTLFLIECLLLVPSTLYSLYLIFNQDHSFQLYKTSLFWIYIGIFTYFISTATIYGLANSLINSSKHEHVFVFTNSIANIVTNLLYSIGLLCPVLTRK